MRRCRCGAQACILFKEGQFEEARAAFEEGQNLAGYTPEITFYIALCHYRLKQYQVGRCPPPPLVVCFRAMGLRGGGEGGGGVGERMHWRGVSRDILKESVAGGGRGSSLPRHGSHATAVVVPYYCIVLFFFFFFFFSFFFCCNTLL